MKKLLSVLLAMLLMLTAACSQSSTDTVSSAAKDTVVILYTNDIHAYIDNDSDSEAPGLSYAELAKLKSDLGENTLLVDAGDHIQGSVYAAMDQGQSVLEIMDEIYDAATLGNHEFDYGTERTLSIINNAKYPYISCNFVHKQSGEPVAKPHVILTAGNVKVGFVGITTPETIASTAPVYFQDENGELIYDFLDGEALYAAVQDSIDALKAEGADYVIALGHVGVDESSETTSRKIIANVSGLCAFIDGHSHTELETEHVTDKDGRSVTLTQTGYYFGTVGKLTIDAAGVKAELIGEYAAKDEAVLAAKNEWVKAVGEMLGQKIGTLPKKLTIFDENGDRLIRVDGTNLGEYVADSYYYYVNFVSELDCDVAIVNGGGVRADIEAGEVSYESLKTVNPFGNMLCAVELKGSQILDMLEWGARSTSGKAGESEEGAFLHTAGLVYTVDTSVKSTVSQDGQGIWTAAPTGEYRVRDVKIYDKTAKAYVALEPDKTYTVAGSNFTLSDKGDGFAMINGRVIKDYIVEDYMALAAYTIAFEDTDGDDLSDIASKNSPLCEYSGYVLNYEEPEGANRVNIS